VARRHGEPNDVDEAAGPPIGHGAAEPDGRLGQHGLPDSALDVRELPAVIAALRALENESVDELASEAHPNPRPDGDVVGQRGGDQVVERPVQVRQRDVDHEPGDRGVRRRLGHLSTRSRISAPDHEAPTVPPPGGIGPAGRLSRRACEAARPDRCAPT
jgi:hypothetical protein